MILFKNDEEKRSKAYRIVTVAAVIIIVLIVSFFMREGSAGDPLDGSWTYAESDWNFTFDGKDGLTIVTEEEFDGSEVSVPMKYSLDRENKIVSLSMNSDKFSEAVSGKPEEVEEEDIRTFAEGFEQSYEYSVDGNELTLMDAESGEQFLFYKN